MNIDQPPESPGEWVVLGGEDDAERLFGAGWYSTLTQEWLGHCCEAEAAARALHGPDWGDLLMSEGRRLGPLTSSSEAALSGSLLLACLLAYPNDGGHPGLEFARQQWAIVQAGHHLLGSLEGKHYLVLKHKTHKSLQS